MDVLCDASVAFKWFHDEEDQVDESRAIARAGSGRLSLRVLDLTHVEIANASLLGRRPVSADAVIATLERLRLIAGAPHRPDASQLTAAIRLAGAHALTVYDALYWAVARQMSWPFVTVDRALLRAGAGVSPVAFCARHGLPIPHA